MKRICCLCKKDLVPSEKCGKCESVKILLLMWIVPNTLRCSDCGHQWIQGSDGETHGFHEECYAKTEGDTV
jgi:hypothetical protein